tara:strand:- start:3782 stop:3985 length:204 start_codon:yes stop_codon:yes gene_type:complete
MEDKEKMQLVRKDSKINFSKIKTVDDMRLIIELLGISAFIKKTTLEKFDDSKINTAYIRGILEFSNE